LCLRLCIWIYICIYIRIRICICIYIYIRIRICICIYIRICICIFSSGPHNVEGTFRTRPALPLHAPEHCIIGIVAVIAIFASGGGHS
jgi:hypothetical protein